MRAIGILWPHSNTTARTNADRRASGALAYFFEAGTTTPRTTYQDADLTTPHTHPVVADAYGRFPAVFLDFGDYRERIKTAGNTQLWDTDDVPNPAPVAPEDGIDAGSSSLLRTGDVFFGFRDDTRGGAVRANGDTIGSANSGAGERANDDTFPLYEELYTSLDATACPLLDSNGSPTTRGANAAADFAADKRLTLPDLRGRSPFGLDSMGNSASSRLASPVVGFADKDKPGYAVGANTHTLALSEVAAHTHGGTTNNTGSAHTHTFSTSGSQGAHTHTGQVTGNQNQNHDHSYNTAAAKGIQAAGITTGGTLWGGGDTSATSGIQSANHTHNFDISSGGTHSHSGTTDNDAGSLHTHTFTTDAKGSDGAHNNVPGAVLGTWYIKL